MPRSDDLARIEEGLTAAAAAVRPFTPGDVAWDVKERGDPVTGADHAADAVLRRILPREDEGWLSEESRDDLTRLECRRVWVVDPIDGTREFVEGIPEWCISIGLVEDGEPVAGGILNPATGERVVGARETGVTLSGSPVRIQDPEDLSELTVLASRSETRRGEWERFQDAPFRVVPCGSVAYKMARVAAGLDGATWTLVPKCEWDVAAGTALVRAAGGVVTLADGVAPDFNQRDPTFPNFLAAGPSVAGRLRREWLAVGV